MATTSPTTVAPPAPLTTPVVVQGARVEKKNDIKTFIT